MNKRYIKLSEDFGDDLLGYYDLLDQILDLIPHSNYECYYVSNGETTGFTSIKNLKNISYQQNLVIWLCSDHLRGVNEFNYYRGDIKPHGLIDLEDICQQHPNQNFILLTPQRNMKSLIAVSNLKIIEIPPYNWMVDKTKNVYKHGYLTKLEIQWNWATFANYPLWHRISLIVYLLFLDLDKTGFLSISPATDDLIKNYARIEEFLTYTMTQIEWQQFEQGYQRLRNRTFDCKLIDPYGTVSSMENIRNYNEILLPIYNQVRVELIPGSVFAEPAPYITEKELQSIYGSNFMILFNAAGTVELMRSWGFDMFDDIVNHNYDLEVDPVKRIIRAISDNIHLLDGTEDVDRLWEINKYRFQKNCIHADGILEKLIDDSLNKFKELMIDINNE